MTVPRLRLGFAAAFVVFAPFAFAAPVPKAATDDDLKAKALKLNDLPDLKEKEKENDTKELQDTLTELLKNKPDGKRLVVIAAKLQADAKPKEPAFQFPAALVLGKLAQNVKEIKTAETFFKLCKTLATKQDSPRKLALAYESLVDLYWDQKKFEEVEELCVEVITGRGGKINNGIRLFAIERLIQTKSRRGDTDAAMGVYEEFFKDSDNWYVLQIKGGVLRAATRYEDAVEVYQASLKALDKDKDLKEETRTNVSRNVRYIVTGLFVELKEIDKAADILKDLVKEVPDSATYKNDLGFIWADNDKNIDESEKLIRDALELDKKAREKAFKEGKLDEADSKKANSSYVDSLGWVLYKNKKYAEAIKMLTEASQDEEEGQHMEIWDHLADAYAANKEPKKAIEMWTKALKFEDISKRDAERRKKITEKLRKAKAALKADGDK